MKNRTKNIRKNVFETNSSSTHSVHIDDSVELLDTIVPNEEGVVELSGDEFGWEVESYNDASTKISYLVTASLQRDNDQWVERLVDIIKEHTGAKEVIIGRNSGDYYEDGYIDHQSSDVADDVFESDENVKSFLFNKKSWLFTSNDNGGADWAITEDGEAYRVDNEY